MQSKTKWYILASIAFALAFIYYLGPILTPFMIGALLAYLGDPIVNRIERLKIPRTLGVVIVFLIFFAIVFVSFFFLIPLLEHQIVVLINKIPVILSWIQTTALPWITEKFGLQDALNVSGFVALLRENWLQAGNIVGRIVRTVTYSGYSIFVFMLYLILVPVVAFYLMRDWVEVVAKVRSLIPKRAEKTVLQLTASSNEVIGAFFRGQLLVMISLGIYYTFSLWILGLDLALLIGIFIGMISVVPYLGFLLGIVVAGISTVIQFHDWVHLVYLGVIFLIGNMLESYVLSPLLVGDRIGLHPVAVIFSVLAGAQLFGFVGVLLALPVAAVIMVLLRFMGKQYRKSEFYLKKAH